MFHCFVLCFFEITGLSVRSSRVALQSSYQIQYLVLILVYLPKLLQIYIITFFKCLNVICFIPMVFLKKCSCIP